MDASLEEQGREAKRPRQEGEFGHSDDHFTAQHVAVGQMAMDGGVAAPQPDEQQVHHDMLAHAAGMSVHDAGAEVAAAAASAGLQVQGLEHLQQQGTDDMHAAAAAQAAAAAAQIAQINAEAAQQAAQQHELQLQAVQAQLAAAAAGGLDAASAAALAGAVPVSAALSAGMQLDPAAMAAAVAGSLNIQGLTVQQLVDANGQQVHLMPDALQLQAAHDAQMFAAHQAGAPDELGEYYSSELQRQQVETVRKADYQALAAAKRSGHLATIQFQLDLPPELADIELTERTGIVEVPMNGDVMMLKRLFQYQAHNKLLPALQTLLTETGEEMADAKDDGSPTPLAHYNVGNNSNIILRISIPEDLEHVPMVDEALASAAYTSATGGARTPSRKTRWTTEQIEALIEGVEKYGLSAWRTIVMDPRLASKNNMQCKDKFRNLCLTIIQGRPERGLTLPWQLKDRVRALIEQENIKV
ncbi:hypothetical protein COO60DRAFT_1531116 [Scenedesmus sp. NREL 46B-D3]|nr:hypothetical protein COO60DRAFT_1531116 [Scenedesmus sp. NREL 46B-D3]